MAMLVSGSVVSWFITYNLFTGRIQPTYIGVRIHLPSTMDIQICSGVL